MNRDPINLQTARTWLDIPQPVVPRAMSAGGRWRLVKATLRATTALAAVGAFAWGAWLVVVSVQKNSRAMPAVDKATPMKAPELKTDGVLDDAWLARTLDLPKHASLMELDLQRLRARLLAEDQVVSATLTKQFPDRLIVQITERGPVARVMTNYLGQRKALLVARDGVIYAGEGYDAAIIETLPWLDGIKLVPKGGGFQPIEGMPVAAELLTKARLEADHLYGKWSVLSLARLESDRKLEVRTKDGLEVIYFTTNDDFFRQLAKLDYIDEALATRAPGAKASIDLSLGQDVPVQVAALPGEVPAGTANVVTARQSTRVSLPWTQKASDTQSTKALFLLPRSQPQKPQREL